jgi:hypothetical protein
LTEKNLEEILQIDPKVFLDVLSFEDLSEILILIFDPSGERENTLNQLKKLYS